LTFVIYQVIIPPMGKKTEQLQIRVTTAEKQAIRRRAAAAGVDVSAYVLARALPPGGARFGQIVRALEAAGDERRSYVLADLNDFLSELSPGELREAVGQGVVERLSNFEQNYVAAMVEHACVRKGVVPPAWTDGVPPLPRPRFATELLSLRPHLLRASPVAFKRRNIFIDSSIGNRV
jgi:hypothetical protein